MARKPFIRRRALAGARGLKLHQVDASAVERVSRPRGGAWIETGINRHRVRHRLSRALAGARGLKRRFTGVLVDDGPSRPRGGACRASAR